MIAGQEAGTVLCVSDVPPFERPPARDVLWRAVAGHLAARAEAGEWSADTRLPGITALAGEYDVSDATVRRAVRFLVECGIVIVIPAKGTFVA